MPQGFDVDTLSPQNISTVAADVGAEMVDFDDTTHDAAFVQFEVDTDNTFPNPTQLGSDADIGLVTQNNQVLKRSDDLMPDTNYFIRAQAENVVYSDDTLFSSAAKSSQGFINDISDKDLSNAAAEPLASEAMTQFTNSRTNLLTYSNVISDFWSLDSPTQAFWNNSSFSGDSSSGFWSSEIDFSSISSLGFKFRGSAPFGSNLTQQNIYTFPSGAEYIDKGATLFYNQQDDIVYVLFPSDTVYVFDSTDLSLIGSTGVNNGASDHISVRPNGNLFGFGGSSTYWEVDKTGTKVSSGSLNGFRATPAYNGNTYSASLDNLYVYDENYSEINSFSLDSRDYTEFIMGENHVFEVVRDDFNSSGNELRKREYSTNQIVETKEITGIAGTDVIPYTVKGNVVGSKVVLTHKPSGEVQAFNISDLSKAWSVSLKSDMETTSQDILNDQDLFFSAKDSANPRIIRVSNSGSVVYNKNFDTFGTDVVGGHDGSGEEAFILGENYEAGSINLYKLKNESLSVNASVETADDSISFSEAVGSSYTSKSLDVSSLSGVKTLKLGLSGQDVSPDNYLQDLYNGPTGSGNSLYIYPSSGSVGASSISVEFGDLELS